MTRTQRFSAALLGLALLPAGPAPAQEATKAAPATPADPRAAARAAQLRASYGPVDPAIEKIKKEGMERSQVMATLSHLTDVIGPRLTASPALKKANEWTRDQMASNGMVNAHLESWGPFGRGWTLKRFSAQVVSPQCIPLIAFPKAWSPGTSGPLTAEVVHFDPKTLADLDKYKGKLKDKIVLMGPTREVKAHFEPEGTRKTEKELLELADSPEPPTRGGGRGGMGRGGAGNNIELLRKRAELLAAEPPALTIDSSYAGDGGTLFVAQASVPSVTPFGAPGQPRVSAWDKNAPKFPPQVVVANEHFNRLARMIAQGETLSMTVDLEVEFSDADGGNAFNTVAEIPGTDKANEVVMMGGHMDSWHAGTGATDNGAGVSVAIEAARIIKALDLKPRRTIRVALWSGEEQGLFGSRAYVKEHFGTSEVDPAEAAYAGIFGDRPAPKLVTKPEYENLSAYFNLDNGTGKVRGIYMEGNEAVRPIFRKWFGPFRELGAGTLTPQRTGGTDHMSFDAINLPGFQFIQDEVEYDTRTHHSNQDVFDRIQAEDLKQAATVMATFVYNAAMMDEKMPRKPMTAAPAGR